VDYHRERFYAYQTSARGLVTPEALRAHFDRSAAWYEARLGRFLPADRSCRLLDCACGYGNFSYFLKQKGYRNVRAVDLDPKQVELARSVGVEAEVGDVFGTLEEPSTSYACVVAVDFLEHLYKRDAVRFVEAAYSALTPGGVLVLRTPCADGPFGASHIFNDVTHEFGATSSTVVGLARMAGFGDVVVLDERPQIKAPLPKAYARLAAFLVARALADAFCVALNVDRPRVWSQSMWIVAHKPATGRPG